MNIDINMFLTVYALRTLVIDIFCILFDIILHSITLNDFVILLVKHIYIYAS